MKLSDYFYSLPQELIAQTPLDRRDNSRLLALDRSRGDIFHLQFTDILNFINPGDVLVINNSKVIPARLFGTRSSGNAKIEVVLLSEREENVWEALVRPGKKCKSGTVLSFGGDFSGEVQGTIEGGLRLIKLSYSGNLYEQLDRYGAMPLPPYITEKLADNNRYQTVYAQVNGSAAAPTAGLHFTEELLEKIRSKGILVAEVTLHVGLGTFRPVKVENIVEHQMHTERCFVSPETAKIVNDAKAKGFKIISVGTTGTRTLESMTENGILQSGSKDTGIFIYPPYKFKMVDGLITNFHLPESTLLMLVSALAGRESVLHAYEEAIAQRYRFFSFGDAMLIMGGISDILG